MAKTLNSAAFLAFLTATTAMPAMAQQAPAEPAATNAETDIIVTAQRKSESLQRVPVAVSVLTAETLAKRNITSENDLQMTTPGLQVRTGSSATQVNFAVRGQSFDQFSGTRPGVLPYLNEVQASSSIGGGGGTTAFYDLESVQLLKGPQGTLFGRNATGGAVLFTTAKPKDDFGGFVAARVGNYSTKQVEGALNVPIVADTLLARFAGFYSDNRGYQTNLWDGSHPGSEERYGLRGSVTFKSGSFKNDLVVDYYHSNGSSVTAALYSVYPNSAAAALFSPVVDFAAAAPNVIAGLWNNYVAAKNNPNIDPNGILSYLNNSQKPRGPYKIASDSANVYRARNIVVTNASSLELGENMTLRNIFGYSRFKSILANDSDGSPYGVAGSSYFNPAAPTTYPKSGAYFDQNGVSKQISEEIQLQGKASALDYTAGFYFSHEKGTVFRPSEFLDIFRLLGAPQITNSNDTSKHRTLAGYGQGTYHLGDGGLAVTLGLRYTSEKITAITLPRDSVYGLALAQPTVYSNFQQRTISNVSWNFGIQDQVNSGLLLYANTRRSYKNGGFNSDQAPKNGFAETGGNSYRTETLTDVELGAKYQGRMGDTPVRLNLALFHNWIENSQRTAFATVAGNPAAITVNVPRAKVYGLELDGTISPASWLNIGGSLNYIHSRFTSQTAFVDGKPKTFATYPDTPEWSGSIYAEVTAPISGSISGTLRGDYYAQSSTFFSASAQSNPAAKLPNYGVANFRAGIQDDAAGWSLSALVKNAFKKTYYTGGIPLGELLGFNTAIPGAPRSFLVEARFKF